MVVSRFALCKVENAPLVVVAVVLKTRDVMVTLLLLVILVSVKQ